MIVQKECLEIIAPYEKLGFNKNEILSVIYGIRKAARMILPSDKSVNSVAEMCNKLGLFFEHIDYPQQLQADGTLAEGDEADKSFYVFFVAADKETVKRMKHVEMTHKDEIVQMGKMLGYPQCCIDLFTQIGHMKSPEIVFQTAANTKGTMSRYLNHIEQGHRFTFHHPCSFDCPASIANAKRLESLVEENASNYKGIYIYFYNGTHIKINGDMSRDTISYISHELKHDIHYHLLYPNEDETFELISKKLKQGNKIVVHDHLSVYNKEQEILRLNQKGKKWILLNFV